MSELDTTALDKKLLSGWRTEEAFAADPRENCGPNAGPARTHASHRRGYAIFKILLIFSLIFAAFALATWSRALAGSPLGIETAGYIYVSVPLKATVPQFDQTALRLDLKGAGVYLLRFEMAQDGGRTRLMTKRKRRNWRYQRARFQRPAAHSNGAKRPAVHTLTQPPRNEPKTRTARSVYLSLLRSYHKETSRAKKRALHPNLKAAYRQALSSAD